ncbi:MAG: nuclear transport factor 2 family protein [Thermoleophilia bacterium]
MDQRELRAAVERHWAASEAGDPAGEYAIYDGDVVVDYPQSKERTVGRDNIAAVRAAQPNKKGFRLRRLLSCGDLAVSEVLMTYDGTPFEMVSIMEFRGGKVVRETQYFADRFEAPASRAKWVTRM